MRVRATRRGFYLKLRDPGGDSFDVPDALFSAKWMKRVEAPEAAEVPPPVVEAPLVAETVSAPAVTEPVIKKRRGRKPKVSE